MIKYLLIANVSVFILQLISGNSLIRNFGLVPSAIAQNLFVWQFFTYLFLHGGFFHLFFNMFALWMFGSDIERAWGGKEFLKYYFLCGVGAGIINFLVSISSPYPIIGASGAVYGVLVAYAMLFPNRMIYIWGIFPVKAKYLVIGFAVIEFLATWNNVSDGIAHFAHLGGMLIGYLYLKSDWRVPRLFSRLKSVKPKIKSRKESKKDSEREEVLQKVDVILDRINEVGYHNLTDEEKKILSDASQILSERKE